MADQIAAEAEKLAELAYEDALFSKDDDDDDEELFLEKNEEEEIRPSLADQQKIGFFSQDRSTQTEKSDILDLKDMMEVLQLLTADANNLKRELSLAQQIMQAQYENNLQEKATDLYCRVNDRIAEIEKMHRERVAVVRRSFRQQLADVIAKLNNDWKKHFGLKLEKEKSRDSTKKNKLAEEVNDLKSQLQQQESVILMLRMQLQQYTQAQENVEDHPSSEEMEEMKEEVEKLTNKVRSLTEALDMKDDTTEHLNSEISDLKEELNQEREKIRRLGEARDELHSRYEAEISNLQRVNDRQKMDVEKQMQDKLRLAREEMLNLSQKQQDELKKQEEERERLLTEQKRAQERLLARERSEAAQKDKADEDINKMRKMEKFLKFEVQRLKRELDRTNRMWEKKFAILQSSLYAIKDESYIRQTLQRQAATLHHASVTYAADEPVGILPSQQLDSPIKPLSRKQKKQLPSIGGGTSRAKLHQQARDIMSVYTVTPPPGRGTSVFSAGESQIVDPNEDIGNDIDDDILPLPTPPPPHQMREESQLSVVPPTNA